MKLFAIAITAMMAIHAAHAQQSGPCDSKEYCSAATGLCLQVPPGAPTSCAAGQSCPSGQTCDAITGTCMLTGKPCVSSCTNTDAYCCPVGEHCFVPTQKGTVCKSRADCSGEEYCCPATKVCVLPDPQTVCNPRGSAPSFRGTARTSLAQAQAQAQETAVDPDMDAFLQFAQTYRKNYHTQAEFNKRFRIFKQTLALIASRNAMGTVGVHNVTKFADLELEEFRAQWQGNRGPARNATAMAERQVKLYRDDANRPSPSPPASIDWSARGAVTSVKNQGQCGSCWAFSATEQIESDNFLKTGKLLDLSPQQITSCDTTSYGCNGGYTEHAYDYVKEAGGIESASAYPYTSGATTQTGTCDFNSKNIEVSISGYNVVSSSKKGESNMAAAIQQGPLSVCVDADAFQTYQSGIIGKGCGTQVNHCVQATGINTDADGKTYWLVRNSWGTDWGQAGYVYVEYGGNNCEIASDATNVNIA